MKHLTLLHANGLPGVPQTIAELGPAESLGVGLCALLSGANHYVGLDVIAHSNPESNQAILNSLIPLFRERAPNPDKGWPEFSSYLDERFFPSHILTEYALRQALSHERIEAIRRAVTAPSVQDSITATYKALYQWVKPGGWMSHQIDFKSHGLSNRWNGYRTCSDRLWEITLGRRPFMINRQPASVHLRLIQEAGFTLVTHQKYLRKDGIRREELAPRWADISDEDLNCSGMYVIATK